MILGDLPEFGIQFDVLTSSDIWRFGSFNFIIDDTFIPGTGTNWTLNSAFASLKFTEQDFSDAFKNDFTLETAHELYFLAKSHSGQNGKDFIELDITELSDTGLELFLFSDISHERLIYTTNAGITIYEKRLPKWTVMNVLKDLPSISSI